MDLCESFRLHLLRQCVSWVETLLADGSILDPYLFIDF